MIRLRVIDRADEEAVLSYHEGEETLTEDAPMQEPVAQQGEVAAEVHMSLVVSVMVGAPV
jgi:hypothetical protein